MSNHQPTLREIYWQLIESAEKLQRLLDERDDRVQLRELTQSRTRKKENYESKLH